MTLSRLASIYSVFISSQKGVCAIASMVSVLQMYAFFEQNQMPGHRISAIVFRADSKSSTKQVVALGQDFTDYTDVGKDVKSEHDGMFNHCQEFQGAP